MGFLAPVSGSGLTSLSGTSGTTTVTLPAGVQDGDDVWVFLRTGANGGTAFTPPSGYTVQGSEFNEATLTGGNGRIAIYRHTWHTGDPKSVTFTHPSTPCWCCLIVRSDGTPSVATDSLNSGNSSGDPEVTHSFNPTTAAHDLRIAVVTIAGSYISTPVLPVDAANDNSPVGGGHGWTFAGNFGSNFSFIATGLVWVSTVGGATSDAGNMNWNEGAATKSWMTRAICLTDGGTDYTGSKEMAPNLADPAISADAIQGNLNDSLNAAKGRFVGGARLL